MSDTEPQSVKLDTGHDLFDRVYDLAIDTLRANIKPWRDGLLEEESPAIMAGKTYTTPWTRDCAYNVWNAGALLAPQASRNTLLSTLMQDPDGVVRIGGQYWDAISWALGAYAYCRVTGDDGFLELAHAAIVNSLRYFEETEFDPDTGLFEGPASYGDGVAAYPEPYDDAGGSSGILDWPAAHPDIGKNRMKALSTNCLYCRAYLIADLMGERLGVEDAQRADCRSKARALRKAINKHLWLPEQGRYAYFIDHQGRYEEYMEGLGHALAILTGVADDDQADAVLANQYVTRYGIPCVWPVFPRFRSDDGMSFGRHNGTVWPFIQGFWATAAASRRNVHVFETELTVLADMADRHHEFKEIYHPITGEPYGGLQIDNSRMRLWTSEPWQTWSATGYIRMIHMGLIGMRCQPDQLSFAPVVPERFNTIRIGPIAYRDMTLDITVNGHGTTIDRFTVNSKAQQPTIPAALAGPQTIQIDMKA